MDKDRIEGSAKEIKGKAKEVVGKVLGDAKLESEGKDDRAAGKMQNAASKTRSRGSNRYGEVLLPGTPCFALLSTCAESASNLLRTEIWRVIGYLPRV
jgi:uncharacterized protein YjbJ (UPF0337 family)